MKGISRGLAAGLVLALAGPIVGPAVGMSSHPVFVPRNKMCVGEPPRQTEDPLSPPCVPFFDGDNRGHTDRGVTRYEVRVVFYNDLGVDGSLNDRWSETDEAPGHLLSANGQSTYLVRTFKRLLSYFNNRYQTYGRGIRAQAVSSSSGIVSLCTDRKVDAAFIAEQRPFAVVAFGENMQCFVKELARREIPVVGDIRDLPRASMLDNPGFVWSFTGDQTENAAMTANFTCDKLTGRPARYAVGPLSLSERKIGMLLPIASSRGPDSAQHGGEVVRLLEERCGLTHSSDGSSGFVVRPFRSGTLGAVEHMQAFQRLGVTTVLCLCVAVQTELDILQLQTAATTLGYHPEWFFDTAARMYRSDWHRQYTLQSHPAFGISPEWYVTRLEDLPAYKAFASVEPAAQPNRRFLADIYASYLVLFNGIQTAGPKLTRATLAAGLATWTHDVIDKTSPLGSFASGDNPYTFRRSALAWRWDPIGHEAGRAQPDGCLRTEGHVAVDGAWAPGDDDLDGEGQCMASHVSAG